MYFALCQRELYNFLLFFLSVNLVVYYFHWHLFNLFLESEGDKQSKGVLTHTGEIPVLCNNPGYSSLNSEPYILIYFWKDTFGSNVLGLYFL